MKNFKLSALLSFIFLLFGVFSVPSALAEEITVTGNGEASTNQVSSGSTQQTTVQQTNNTNISNTVNSTANTGNNTASSNTGGNTSIASGNANTSTSVSNTGNSSTVSQSCACVPISNSTTVTGNGEGSRNSVNYSNSTTTSVSINNVANITNNITTNANTGGNTGSGNVGNTSIRTGNIWSNNSLINGPFNISSVSLADQSSESSSVKVSGNGESSVNNVIVSSAHNMSVLLNNVFNINNILNTYANTGGNIATSNVGNVDISTGDIILETSIVNAGNINFVKIDCGCNNGVPTPPIPPVTTVVPPSVTPPTGGGGGGSNGPSSIVQSAAAAMNNAVGRILPSTGGSWLFFALIGNILMFLLGAYLRLRSGRSPGFALAA